MERADPATRSPRDVDVDPRRSAAIDLRQVRPDLETVRLTLEAVAADLRSLWLLALGRGDLAESERLVDASHAVHGAIVALAEDSLIAARSSPPRAGRGAASTDSPTAH